MRILYMARVSRSIRSDSPSRQAELAAFGHAGPVTGADRARSAPESLSERTRRDTRQGTKYLPLDALLDRAHIAEPQLRDETRQEVGTQDPVYHGPELAVLSSYGPGGLHMLGLGAKCGGVRPLTG